MKREVVLVAGSANLDFVVRAPHVPRPGETILGGDFRTFPGGKGANQAVAAARAGAPTRMLVALGEDLQARPLEASLAAANVELVVRRIADQPTGVAFICVGDDGENAITVASGANLALRPDDLPPLDDVACLLMQLESPFDAVASWAARARAAGVTVMLNAAPAPASALPAGLLANVDVLIVNEGELSVLTGDAGSIESRLRALGVPRAIVTLGARGCWALDDGRWIEVSALRVMPVDTTGAGDTFCGAFAASIARGRSFDEALRYATAAAGLACLKPGAQSSIPTDAEVEAALAT